MQSDILTTIYTADSQATLVNRDPLTLVFSHNSVLNATLTAAGKTRYIIATKDKRGSSKTSVLDAGMEPQRLIACIDRGGILPATVAFPERNNEKPVRIGKWLKSDKLSDGLYVKTIFDKVEAED